MKALDSFATVSGGPGLLRPYLTDAWLATYSQRHSMPAATILFWVFLPYPHPRYLDVITPLLLLYY